MLDVLVDWLRSGKDHLGASAADDVEDKLLAAEVWVSAALGNRLVVKLWSKVVRNIAAWQLVASPECHSLAPASRINAKLTPM